MRIESMILLLVCSFQAGFCQEPRTGQPPVTWKVIANSPALFTNDHYSIEVWPPYDHFQKLQLKVSGAPLRLIKIKVIYSEGVPDVLPLSIEVPDGKVSRTINLQNAGVRSIRRIDF